MIRSMVSARRGISGSVLLPLLALAVLLPAQGLALPARGSLANAVDVLLHSAAHIRCGEKILAASYALDPTEETADDIVVAVLKGGKVSFLGRTVTPSMDRQTLEAILKGVCDAIQNRSGSRGALQDPEIHTLGLFPLELLAAHFDGDNAPDLAAVNQNSNNVSILMGIPGGSGTSADPSYENAVHFPTGTKPTILRSGDFDEDDRVDLLTANLGNANNGNLTILLGNGDGTFDPPVALATGNTPNDAAVGLLDADSHLDIVVPDPQNQRLLVLFGNGNGTFDPPAARATPDFPGKVVVADVDVDGISDLVTNESILIGNGDGTYQPGIAYAGTLSPFFVRVADVDEDELPDLVTTNINSNTVSVLRGIGGGAVEPFRRYAVGNFAERLEVGDIDRDGHLDVLVSNFSSDHLSLLWGYGDGTFEGAPVHLTTTAPFATTDGLALAHLNGDTFPDLAVGHGTRDAAILPGVADGGGFGAPVALPNQDGSWVVAARFDDDNLVDLAFAPGTGSNDVEIRLRTGNLTFGPALGVSLPEAGASAARLLAIDMDADTFVDLVTTNQQSGGVSVLLGNGDGGFAAQPVLATGTRPTGFAAGSLDGDDLPDLAVANAGDFGQLNGKVTVHLTNGQRGFASPITVLGGTSPDAVAIADFNLDGHGDLAVSLEYQQFYWGIRVLLGNGNGGFGAPLPVVLPAGADFGVRAVQSADLNGDGRPDLFASLSSNEVVLLPGLGDGTFEAAQKVDNGAATAVLAADADRDRKPDLLSAIGPGGGGVSVLLNRTVFPVFSDGFESGDLSAWSASSP